MIISKRLKTIYDFIDKEDNVIDVGCDHALLDVYLYLNKKNKHIVASDINKGPLKKAKENINKYKVKAKTVLQDGIDNLFNSDTIVISGMGTTNIIEILFRNNNLNNVNKIILSSNNDYYDLRKAMYKNGFYIEKENLVYERGKYYPIMLFRKGKRKITDLELKYGPYLIKEKSSTFISYIKESIKKYNKIYNSLPKKYIIKRIKIKKEIKSLQKI